jgi:hypothetical protein
VRARQRLDVENVECDPVRMLKAVAAAATPTAIAVTPVTRDEERSK